MTTELATFGGGCFWCTEATFQEVRGVTGVASGYSGGARENPTYEQVCSGATGHAEVVQISYNPDEVSYEDLARVHLGTHDPTTPDQQGADKGTQYRSIILYRNEEEGAIASKSASELGVLLERAVVTEIVPFEVFYEAEARHQDYYKSNPQGGYCTAVIDPKLGKFRDTFAHLLKAAPE